MSDVLRAHTVVVDQVVIGTGATINVVGQIPKLIQTTLKYGSGQTLWILGTTNLPAGFTGGWLFGASEIHHVHGPANFWLGALGATTVVQRMRVYGEGYNEGTFIGG